MLDVRPEGPGPRQPGNARRGAEDKPARRSLPTGRPDPWVRHLCYFIYPVAGNGVWQSNVDRLRRRLDLFNGRLSVAIVAGNGGPYQLDPPAMVRDRLGLDAFGTFIVNTPRKSLGEVNAFPLLWQRVKLYQGPHDVTFYGHAKGVTPRRAENPTVHRWTDLMYAACLDHWPDVAALLETHPAVGAFKTSDGGGGWFYSGTFYWFRNRDTFGRKDWDKIHRGYGGVEVWPRQTFAHDEAACVFYGDTSRSFNLYDAAEVTRAEASLKHWPAPSRGDAAPSMTAKFAEAIGALPDPPDLAGRAILTETSPDFLAGTYVLVKMLRHTGCALPVQVWATCDVPDIIAGLPGVEVRRHRERATPRAWGETDYRTEAILTSGLAEVLVMGSDAYPVADVSRVFDDLRHSGVIVWREGAGDESYPFFPRVFGMTDDDAARTWTVQGDVYAFDLRRAWRVVQAVHWLNLHHDYFRNFGWLDQSYWRAALCRCGVVPYTYSPQTVVASEPFGAFTHHGPDGPLVIHRSCAKMMPPNTARLPLPMEDVAWEFYEEYVAAETRRLRHLPPSAILNA